MSRILLILVLLLPELAFAHGLKLSATTGNDAIVGEASFADGSPLVGVLVELRHVIDSSAATSVVTTRTDVDGRYAFPAPRQAGEYRIITHDGLGHRAEVVLATGSRPSTIQTTHDHSPWSRWFAGLGYLCGLFGVAAWWLSRRDKARSETL